MLIEILILSIKMLTEIIDAQINDIKTLTEILIDVVKTPTEVIKILTDSLIILSEVVYHLREIFELSDYNLKTVTKKTGIHLNSESSLTYQSNS